MNYAECPYALRTPVSTTPFAAATTVSEDRLGLGQIPVNSWFFSPVKGRYRTITGAAIG
jgi:hypothetical protein